MKLGEALYIKEAEERRKTDMFKNKIEGLKQYIESEFPEGCKNHYGDSCRYCPLQLCYEGTKWFYLCELLEYLSRSEYKEDGSKCTII